MFCKVRVLHCYRLNAAAISASLLVLLLYLDILTVLSGMVVAENTVNMPRQVLAPSMLASLTCNVEEDGSTATTTTVDHSMLYIVGHTLSFIGLHCNI